MDFIIFIFFIILILAVAVLFIQNKRLKNAGDKGKTQISTDITKLKSVGELSVFKIYSKEIVTKKDSPMTGMFDKLLGWTMTKKQIAVIFEFEIDFIYDLKNKNFEIEHKGDGNFKVKMPPCDYKFSIKDMKIYDEQNSKFMPFLLPDSLNSLFGPSFDESEKNRLIDEAKDEIKSMSVKIINDLGDRIHASASSTIDMMAKSFGAKNLEFEFMDKNINKLDVKDSTIELDSVLEKQLTSN